MSLVGDIIMELRSRIPDAPSVLPPPQVTSAGGVVGSNGVLFGSTTYQVYVTATTGWGETIAVGPISVSLTGGQNAIAVEVFAPTAQYQNFNVYISSAAANVITGKWTLPVQAPGNIVFITAGDGPPTGGATPPTRPTSFDPDSDGNFIGAYTAYRLLNRALQEMVKIGGGIVDLTGVQSVINQSMYRLESPFYTFTNAWYDGYPMDVVPRSFMYLRNSAAGFSGILSYEQDGPQSVIQVWPQSNRRGGQTVLTSSMGVTDTVAFINNGTGFLSIGLAQIDSEIVAFSQITNNGAVMQGITRGLGGTDIVAHNASAPVTELNIRLSGYRLAKNYVVGNSLQTLMVPPAWETPLVLHMLSQVRSMEQDENSSKDLLAQFVQMADKIAKQSRLGRLKPRQIPIWGQNTSDARNVNGIGFGWLIN